MNLQEILESNNEGQESLKTGIITVRGIKFIQIAPLRAYLKQMHDALKDKKSDLAVGYTKAIKEIDKKLSEMS